MKGFGQSSSRKIHPVASDVIFRRRFEGLHSTLTLASLCLDQGTGTNRSEESDQAKDSQIDLDGYRCRY